ncbi:UNVERIFIED_CONTAM: hypothetical protein RMT77_007200 [Armadillidium vulgare]
MGNTEAILKFEELEIDRSQGEVHEDWNIIQGKLRENSVTVFSSTHPQSSRKRPFIEKALQASKVYRHPNILKYVDGGFLGNEVIIITEEAMPLLNYGLENMSFLQITAGLASVIEALSFLHDKAGLSHNNVCASSIYVTSEGIWKLWGLEYCCSFGDLTRDHIERINQYCSEKNIPPDEKSRITPAYQHARDAYFFGKFIETVIAPFMNASDYYEIEEFLSYIKLMALHKEWSKRPRFSSLLEHPVFQHDFLKLRNNLNNALILSTEEREEFLRGLPDLLKKYSDEVIASTFSSTLLSHSFLLIPSSATYLMPCLLTPKSDGNDVGLFSEKVFKESIIPHILNLFSIHDATIRKILLTHFSQFAPFIDKIKLSKFILPQLLLGIRDVDEDIVAKTLHALGHLIPLIGADVVTGVNREPIFAAATPKSSDHLGVVLKSQIKKKEKNSSDQSGISAPVEDHLLENIKDPSVVEDSFKTNSVLSLNIPERSSPDGGETLDTENSFLGIIENNCDNLEETNDDRWSDWEEMLDQPLPEIVGILQVKTSDTNNTDVIFPVTSESNFVSSSIIKNRDNIKESRKKTSVMQLKSQKDPKVVKPQGLGEEYDIKSLQVEKKPDVERDFFADLTPSFLSINYNLETMLIEASNKSRQKLPSLSETLAELDDVDIEEGAYWNEDSEWTSEENSVKENVLKVGVTD